MERPPPISRVGFPRAMRARWSDRASRARNNDALRESGSRPCARGAFVACRRDDRPNRAPPKLAPSAARHPIGLSVRRRSNGHLRCLACRMRESLCICDLVSPLVTRTRLVLFIHREEDRKSTNTGRLAARCLVNSTEIVRGHRGEASAPFAVDAAYQPLLLFPHGDAAPLDDWTGCERPIVLVVPDGTWRQAAKVRHRVLGLADVPCVSLPVGTPSAYRLRSEAHPGGLATFEAIARALGVLEGPEVETALSFVFRAMVERTLWSRGTVGKELVQSGVPGAAHDERQRSGRQSHVHVKVGQ
jgi:DTW domain-containing protein YfiP